jgi:hypothetical protein
LSGVLPRAQFCRRSWRPRYSHRRDAMIKHAVRERIAARGLPRSSCFPRCRGSHGPRPERPWLARQEIAASAHGAGHECGCRFILPRGAVRRPFGGIRRQDGAPRLVAAHARFVRALPSGASLHARTGSQVAGEARARGQQTRALIQVAQPGLNEVKSGTAVPGFRCAQSELLAADVAARRLSPPRAPASAAPIAMSGAPARSAIRSR